MKLNIQLLTPTLILPAALTLVFDSLQVHLCKGHQMKAFSLTDMIQILELRSVNFTQHQPELKQVELFCFLCTEKPTRCHLLRGWGIRENTFNLKASDRLDVREGVTHFPGQNRRKRCDLAVYFSSR